MSVCYTPFNSENCIITVLEEYTLEYFLKIHRLPQKFC